jgi:hypothetical protein
VVTALLAFLSAAFRTRAALHLEILALRHQIGAVSFSPRLFGGDRGDEQGDYTIHSEVRLVLLDVSVKDRGGVPVLWLSKDNFAVFENGRPQRISTSHRSWPLEHKGQGANSRLHDGLRDAAIQPISGHGSNKSLEVYQHLSLAQVEPGYEWAVNGLEIWRFDGFSAHCRPRLGSGLSPRPLAVPVR